MSCGTAHTLSSNPFKSVTPPGRHVRGVDVEAQTVLVFQKANLTASVGEFAVNLGERVEQSPARIAGSVSAVSTTTYVHEFGAPVSKETRRALQFDR